MAELPETRSQPTPASALHNLAASSWQPAANLPTRSEHSAPLVFTESPRLLAEATEAAVSAQLSAATRAARLRAELLAEAQEVPWREELYTSVGTTGSSAMLGWLLLSLLLASLLALLASSVTSRRRPRRDAVLLFGPSGSGKTALFAQLRAAQPAPPLAPTVTSLTPNVAPIAFAPQGGVTVTRTLVDLPGHPRLRGLFDAFAPRALALIFLVDGREGIFLPGARATAECGRTAAGGARLTAPAGCSRTR